MKGELYFVLTAADRSFACLFRCSIYKESYSCLFVFWDEVLRRLCVKLGQTSGVITLRFSISSRVHNEGIGSTVFFTLIRLFKQLSALLS